MQDNVAKLLHPAIVSPKKQIQEKVLVEDELLELSDNILEIESLEEKISSEFDIELDKAKNIVEYIEESFYDNLYSVCKDFDDLGEICREHFEGMYYDSDEDYRY